jgi:HD-like signal output (HDOD) protein
MNLAAENGGTETTRHVLFVEDEPEMLERLQRMLRPQQGRWEMQFAGSGEEALRVMEAGAIEVVVTDMRMPGMDGAQLLEQVRDRFPGVVRIVLSAHHDMPSTLRAVPVAHQFLSKPCSAGSLADAVERACAVRKAIQEDMIRRVVGAVGELPCLPRTSAALMRALDDPDVPIAMVGHIVERDVSIAAKVMQLANSAFFGRASQVTTIGQAVAHLGTQLLRQLVAAAEIFHVFQGETRAPGYTVKEIQSHSQQVAAMAARMPLAPGAIAECAVTALLHDVGKLVMATRLPSVCDLIAEMVASEAVDRVDAEERLLGVNHADIGAYLLALWGLPVSIVEAVRYHHRLKAGSVARPAMGLEEAVYFSNLLVVRWKPQEGKARELPPEAAEYLRSAGLDHHLEEWLGSAEASAAAWGAECVAHGRTSPR